MVLLTNRDGGSPSFFTMKITDGCDDVPEVGYSSMSSGQFTFSASGQPYASWDVYQSTDLTNWTFTTNVTLGSVGSIDITDNSISGVPYRFYKLSDSNCCSQVVGYYRIQVGAGTTNSPGTNGLLALQLDSPFANTLDGLFNVGGSGTMPDGTALPDGSVIQKWDVASQILRFYTWNSGTGWLDASSSPAGSIAWDVGEGAYLVVSNATTVTFVGTVREGVLSRTLPGTGLPYLVGSMLPKAGGLQSNLSYIPSAGNQVFLWTGFGPLTVYTYRLGNWSPQQPVLDVGQGFFWKGTTNNWQMSFFPCQ
jgi:hypothetical protein